MSTARDPGARAMLLAAALLVPSLVFARCSDVELPASAKQGALVAGCAPPGTSVHVGERALRIDGEGRFVFGIGRDASGATTVSIRPQSGAQRAFDIAIEARDWRIERVDGLPQQTVTPDPKVAARIAREQARVAAARDRDDARSDFADGFSPPLEGRISGVYGSQRVLNGTPRNPHMGLDIAAATGTPVLAPAAGIVSFAADDLYLTGGTVLLDHGHGLSSSFLHLSAVDVREGQQLKRGQRIGAVGATGRASGPHLHWGLNWFGVRLDPALLPVAVSPR